jgi:hypothetical protein
MLLAGCASAGDIKPGVIRGVDSGRGYVKTSEGFGIATKGCADAELWQTVETATRQVSVSGRTLEILWTDQHRGQIAAADRYLEAAGGGSYVGVFIHNLGAERRLVEVSAFWRSRMGGTVNPWEPALLSLLAQRISCVIPPAEAITRRSATAP